MQGHSGPLSRACETSEANELQVLTAVEEFAVVRDKLQELGQQIDHDHSGLVYTPLTHVEVPSTLPQRHSARQQRHPCRMHCKSCMST